jgi:putative endonuclease
MGIQKIHGDWAEGMAAAFLEEHGTEILERNWRYKRAEVDIIAKEGAVLVFVEVKMKTYVDYGRPEEKVDRRKKRLLIDAAMAYMRAIGHEWEIRFDILAIIGGPGEEFGITHYKDAFFPGLGYGENDL